MSKSNEAKCSCPSDPSWAWYRHYQDCPLYSIRNHGLADHIDRQIREHAADYKALADERPGKIEHADDCWKQIEDGVREVCGGECLQSNFDDLSVEEQIEHLGNLPESASERITQSPLPALTNPEYHRGYRDGWDDQGPTIRELQAERDALAEEVAHMKPVYREAIERRGGVHGQ